MLSNSSHSPNPRTRLFAIALLTFAFALPFAPFNTLNAQDVTIGTPVTFTGLDDGQNRKPLKLKHGSKLFNPAELLGPNTYGYLIAFSHSKHDSTRLSFAENTMTDKELQKSCLENGLYTSWEWEAAVLNKNDPRQAWVAFIFNPASASASKKDAAPRLLEVIPVFLPVSGIPADERVAQANVTIGVSGEITSVKITSPNKLASQNETLITDVVSKWKIAPARANGVATEATINVPILLLPDRLTKKPATVIAKKNAKKNSNAITQINPLKEVATAFPSSAGDDFIGQDVRVTLEFTLADDGSPQNPVVVLSPNKKFDAPALKAIRQYRFETPDPSKSDSIGNTYTQLSDARWQYVVNFWKPGLTNTAMNADLALSLPGHTTSAHAPGYATPPGTVSGAAQPIVNTAVSRSLASQGMAAKSSAPGASSKGQNITRPVLAPQSIEAVAPVYPYSLLKGNITGSATVRLPRGLDKKTLEYTEIMDASKKEFGLALAASLHFYKITPASFMGKPTASMLNVTFDFNPANPALHLSEKTKQLLADETKNPQTLIPEGKLDKRLRIQKNSPNPPAPINFDVPLKGATIIEFLVDETGRVHLPRIIKTSAPEAAYVLMQRISMRVYDPPMQNGKPVVARAREEVNLDAMKK